jgi:hypothetical protein
MSAGFEIRLRWCKSSNKDHSIVHSATFKFTSNGLAAALAAFWAAGQVPSLFPVHLTLFTSKRGP